MAQISYRMSALIVESNVGMRIRLKQTLSSLPNFTSLVAAGSIADGAAQLASNVFDVIFLSHNFTKDEAALFIVNAKKDVRAQDTAFVAVFSGSKNPSMSDYLLAGFDGMLCEPYSANSLYDICQLAMRVKGERRSSREKTALHLIIHEMSRNLDTIATLKSSGFEPNKGFLKLHQSATGLQAVSPEALANYDEIFEKVFATARPAVPSTKKYSGASRRIRDKIFKKILDGAPAEDI